MVENIPDRLREQITTLGLSLAEVSRRSGEKSPQRLKDVLAGRQKCPVELLARLDAIGVDISYVLTGSKSLSVVSEPVSLDERERQLQGALPVPMYDIEAAAGAGRLFDAEMIESTFYLPVELFEADAVDPVQVVGVTARGDSMGDTVRDREQVLVNRARRTPDGVFLLRMDDELRIKRVQRVAGGAWVLISDNSAYERELVQPEDVEIIGQCWRKVGRVF